ncbi:uncharacterized protein LOC118412936 isoform X2 [Branchiostoma floridae]|uniref:Uncharacterized protein LOC118412936 isoform X2 n=1 Tax=Branchiostoma floridae TaxID=7739 RepID=A0A9J7KX56_BRAFL|nr:uncharacterized protein LOC118412936 isoform X2 [Branchiostoma floridae]
MPKAVAQSKQHRKQNGQKQYHSWNACTSTSNTSRKGPRSKSSCSSRSQHNTELTAGFTAQPMRRRFYEEQDEGERVQQRERVGYFRRSPVKTRSGVGDIPKHPASTAQSRSAGSEGRGRGGYWRTSPVQTRSGRRTSRHPPSASQSRSDSRERAEEATTSQAGEHHGNGRRDQDAGISTLQHGTNHNTRSSIKHPRLWQSASHSGITGETTRRAPHRRSPIQTRSSSRSHSQGSYAQATNRQQSTQLQPRAKAAQRKKNSSKQVSVNVSQAGTIRGTAVRQRPGTAQSTRPTSSRPQKSSGARQGNRKTAVPTRGKARPAERKTGRKANGTTATPRGGTAQSGERKRGVKQTKVATQTKGKKRTGSQAFGSQGSQATAEAGIAVKGIKQTGTVKSAKKQNESPTTAEATKKQKIAEPDCCPICLSELTTQQLAHPDVCRHVFCLGCLQTWQQRRNTCPIDNKQFQTLVLCGLDGKDQMPVVENQNNRNGVVPAGNQPNSLLPVTENRSDARGQMDHNNDQRGYAGPGNWGYDERGWDDSSSLPDDEEYLPTFASIFEDDTYDDPENWRDDQRGWYDMPSIEPPPAFDDYPSDDDDDSTVIPISSDSERRDTNVNGGSEHSDQGDWVIACRYRRAPEERDNSHQEDRNDGHGSGDDYHGDWGTEEGNSDSDQGDWVVGCDFTRAPEEWDNSHQEDWDDGHGSRDDYHGDWGAEEGNWDDEQEEQDDGEDSWDYDDERSRIAHPYQGAHFAHWGAGSAHWSNGQRQSGDAQPDWARRYDMWAYQQSQIWNGYDYGSGYHQQAHWQWPRWWSDSSSSDEN